MKDSPTQSHVLQLSHPPIPVVRIGIIGLGNRGLLTLQRYLQIEGIEINALCEIREGNLAKAQQLLKENNRPGATGYTGPEGWKKMCEHDELDIVFICTDWLMHTAMATFAMECNKHVAIEVPAAMSVEECWQLVDTAEKTRRHCIMLENCCYVPCILPKKAKEVTTTTGGKDIASNIRVIPIPLMVWDLPARYLTFTGAIKWNTSFQCPPTKQA